MVEDDQVDAYIMYLVDNGILIPSGMLEEEFTYKVNFDKAKEFAPYFYSLMIAEMEESLLELYEKGFVDVEYDENLNAFFRITPEGQQALEGMMDDLGS